MFGMKKNNFIHLIVCIIFSWSLYTDSTTDARVLSLNFNRNFKIPTNSKNKFSVCIILFFSTTNFTFDFVLSFMQCNIYIPKWSFREFFFNDAYIFYQLCMYGTVWLNFVIGLLNVKYQVIFHLNSKRIFTSRFSSSFYALNNRSA